MKNGDNYLLLLIGVLVISLIAVETIPMPAAPVVTEDDVIVPSEPVYVPPKLSSATKTLVKVIPTSTLATVTAIEG